MRKILALLSLAFLPTTFALADDVKIEPMKANLDPGYLSLILGVDSVSDKNSVLSEDYYASVISKLGGDGYNSVNLILTTFNFDPTQANDVYDLGLRVEQVLEITATDKDTIVIRVTETDVASDLPTYPVVEKKYQVKISDHIATLTELN